MLNFEINRYCLDLGVCRLIGEAANMHAFFTISKIITFQEKLIDEKMQILLKGHQFPEVREKTSYTIIQF